MIKILATGTFDILHTGHLDYLEEAKSLGDYLVVHVESDQAVKRHKGSGRPVNNEKERRRIIDSLSTVNETILADGELQSEKILKQIQPDVLVIAPKKSFDLKKKEVEFKKICPSLKVIWFDQKNNELSTSRILNKIKQEI